MGSSQSHRHQQLDTFLKRNHRLISKSLLWLLFGHNKRLNIFKLLFVCPIPKNMLNPFFIFQIFLQARKMFSILLFLYSHVHLSFLFIFFVHVWMRLAIDCLIIISAHRHWEKNKNLFRFCSKSALLESRPSPSILYSQYTPKHVSMGLVCGLSLLMYLDGKK